MKEPVAGAFVHYDSDRVMNVGGHGSVNLFRAVRSFCSEAGVNHTPTVPSGMQGIQRGGTAKSASNDGPSEPEGGVKP